MGGVNSGHVAAVQRRDAFSGSGMNTARYVLALVCVLTYPLAVGSLLLAHPFISFWRRAGRSVFFAALAVLSVAAVGATYAIREPLLAVHYGTKEVLWPVALFLWGLSLYVEVQCRKHRKLKTALGVPELDPDGQGGELVTEGIYGRMRHPRYVAVWLGTAGVALFTNYLAVYVIAVAMIPALYLVVVFEERALMDRFGLEYGLYTQKVPRFIPRARGQGA